MSNDYVKVLGRLHWIERWSLHRNTISENVAEHSWAVSVIAHMLAVINRDVFGGSISPDRMATLAVFHDASECITGDLPTPIKYYSDELRLAYKRIEYDALQRLVSMMPEDVRAAYSAQFDYAKLGTLEVDLLKAADNIAAFRKAKLEMENGNKDYADVYGTLNDWLIACDLAEVGYFRSRFLSEQPETDFTPLS